MQNSGFCKFRVWLIFLALLSVCWVSYNFIDTSPRRVGPQHHLSMGLKDSTTRPVVMETWGQNEVQEINSWLSSDITDPTEPLYVQQEVSSVGQTGVGQTDDEFGGTENDPLQLSSSVHLDQSSKEGNLTTRPESGTTEVEWVTEDSQTPRVTYLSSPSGKKGKIEENGGKKPTAILITTNMRSGSSFTATLFEENPAVVYHFEPLHVAQHNLLNSKIKKNYTCDDGLDHICLHQGPKWIVQGLLTGLYCAEIPDFYRNYFELKNKGNKLLRPTDNRRCSKVNMCGRVCPYYTNETAEMTWKRSDFISVKSTRVGKLEYLQPLAADDRFDLKIVHLLRDPRGIINSRKRINAYSMYRRTKSVGETLVTADATYLCKRIASNLFYAKNSDWLTPENYMMIRYEDIVADPMAAVDRMYEFTGLKMHERVMKFIKTEALQPQKKRNMSPKEITQSWHTHLSPTLISHIQKSCEEIFTPEWTGYKPVDISKLKSTNIDSVGETKFHI